MLNLSEDELLILFEFCHRVCETNKIAFSHHAEAVVIDKIAGELERSLTAPFQKDYPERLRQARGCRLQEYEKRMGANGWIHKLPLDQI